MKQLSTLQRYILLLFVMLHCFSIQITAQYVVEGGPVGGSCGDIYYRITTTGSDCGKHGKIDVDLWGPAIEGVGATPPTFTDVKYRCFITGSDSTNVEFFDQKLMTNLAPGKYTVEIEGKCAESAGSLVPKRLGVFVQVDQLGGWSSMDMQAQIRVQPLGCLANGTVRLHGIRGGLPPYKIEITEAPAGYTKGVKYSGSTLPTNGEFVIDDLITGTYKVVFSETSSCNETISLTFTMGSTTGLPEFSTFFNSANVYPSERVTPYPVDHCRSFLLYRTTSFTSEDQLKFKDYVQNSQNYFEYTVFYPGDDISNPDALTWTSFPTYSSYFRIDNLRYPISEIKIQAASLSYPSPFSSNFNELTKMPRMLVRVKGCTEIKQYDFGTTRPYPSSVQTYKDCGQGYFTASMYTDYDGVLCYPFTYQLVKTKDASGTAITEEIAASGTVTYSGVKPTTGPLSPGTYEYRCTDAGGFSWLAGTYTYNNTNTPVANTYGTYIAKYCDLDYVPTIYISSNNSYNISMLSKVEYVRTEKSSDYGSTWTTDNSFPAPVHPVIDVQNDIPLAKRTAYPYHLSPYAREFEDMPFSNSATNYTTIHNNSSYVVQQGDEKARYQHIFNVTDTCGISREIKVEGPSQFYRHDVEPQIEVERGCLSGITISIPNLSNIIRTYIRQTTGTISTATTAYAWVHSKPAGASVTYSNTSNSYISNGTTQAIEVDAVGTYTIGISTTSSAKNYPDLYCTQYYDVEITKAPTFELDDINTAMYRCPGNQPGQGYIEVKVKNGMGPFRFELYDENMTLLASNTDGLFDNGAWSSTIASDKYIIKAYDEGCLPERIVSFEQGITVYDLSNKTTAWIRDPNVCEGDSIVLQALALGKTAYDWAFIDDYGNQLATYEGRRVVIKDATLAMSGRYVSTVSVPGCSGVKVMDTVSVSVGEKLMYWKTDAEDDNWFNTNNWLRLEDGQLEPVRTVPAPCTTVHIPGNAQNYPNLSKWDNSFGQAACDTIVYHYGAETAYPNYLTYKRAVVQYNMGYYSNRGVEHGTQPTLNADSDYPGNGGEPTTMERARWYMVSAPLKQMVGGDFALAGYPKIYQRLFNTTRPEAGKPMTDNFSGTFNNYTIPTVETSNALALWIPDFDNYVGSANHKHLNNLQGIIEIPYIYNTEKIKENRPLHNFVINGKDSVSYFYYFRADLTPEMDQFDTIERGYRSHRFIFEDSNNDKINEWVGSEYVTLYRMPLDASYDGTGRIMIGNPFMSSIDFDKLYALNSSVIKEYYEVVSNGNGLKYYGPGDLKNDLDNNIAPLQAFIVERRNPANSGESIVFHMNGTSSVIAVQLPNDPLPKLKNSEAAEAVEDYLIVKTSAKGAAQNGSDFSSSAGVEFNKFASSNIGRSIFNEYLANRADVFFTDDDNYLYSQLVKNETPKPATLYSGMFSQFAGSIEMTVFYNGGLVKSVKFTDTYTNTVKENVESGWKYTFNQNIKWENGMYGLDTKRFRFDVEYYPETTGIVDLNDVSLNVAYFNKTLTVESSAPVAHIKLTTLAGVPVFGDTPSNRYSYKKNINVAPGAYIVQVVLENGEVKTSKIIVQ